MDCIAFSSSKFCGPQLRKLFSSAIFKDLNLPALTRTVSTDFTDHFVSRLHLFIPWLVADYFFPGARFDGKNG